MQFEPATFAVYDQPIPPGGVTPPSPYDPVDAIYAAGRMLCANGVRRGDVSAAVFAYNHSTAYVQQVLAQAHAYATLRVAMPGSCNDVQATSTAALAAIVFACDQLGQPYVWGGNGPSDGGFDCSGLTTAAYAAAGITLPRTADARKQGAQARVLAGQSHAVAAVTAYVQALGLWQGRCGAGLDSGARASSAFAAVDREAAVMTCDAADVALRSGQVRMVLPALWKAVGRDPLDEALHARLLLCLAENGQQAEALTRYDMLRRRLADELGMDPGAELMAAHQRVLRQQISSRPPPSSLDVRAEEQMAAPPVRPAQLPPDLPCFTGRDHELAFLDELLAGGDHPPVTVAIDGMPGVGKSTLAVRWAHRAAERFPDGQLFLDLRGFTADEAPLDQADALRSLLSGLGVPPHAVPADIDSRIGLYRSILAGRRTLVVLDNARDEQQAAALLPAAAGCAGIVTSRKQLTGLAVHGARTVTVEPLTLEDARASLRARIGAARADAEPSALEVIIECCACLPLAIAVVGARAQASARFSLTAIADELRAGREPLEALATIHAATFDACSPGPTRRCGPRPPASSGCCRCTPARTSRRPRRPAWPPRRSGRPVSPWVS
jgi:hypothetical protein